MKTIVGILKSQADVEQAVSGLRRIGIKDDRINLLTPQATARDLNEVPTTQTEQPGMGAAIGGVVGGSLGAASGMGLGAAAASLLVPGVGAVMALGLAGAALLAAGGAIGGAAVGDALEDSMARGLPVDELFVYEEALKQGRSVLIVFAEDSEQADKAREVLEIAGAESVDLARERWWVGLRDVERESYSEDKNEFEEDETTYRRGFETAMRPSIRGTPYDEALASLKVIDPDFYQEEPFRLGFERGRNYYENSRRKPEKARKKSEKS